MPAYATGARETLRVNEGKEWVRGRVDGACVVSVGWTGVRVCPVCACASVRMAASIYSMEREKRRRRRTKNQKRKEKKKHHRGKTETGK